MPCPFARSRQAARGRPHLPRLPAGRALEPDRHPAPAPRVGGNLGAELTAQENAEIERFRARVGEVRGELRNTERDLRGDINRLQALVVFINVWLAPILVALVGLFLFWRRQRRARVGARR